MRAALLKTAEATKGDTARTVVPLRSAARG
jgi:hypothetical protein